MKRWTAALMRPRWAQRLRYEAIYAWPGWGDVSTFNGGYWPADPDIVGDPTFSAEPNQIQLYFELFSTAAQSNDAMSQADVLEVAAGRGGGLTFVKRRFAPKSLTGLELTAAGVRHGRRKGLTMVRGAAQALPFDGGRFDIVFSLDSFFHLSDRERILPEMHRVLRPGGLALVGDFILASPAQADGLTRMLAEAADFRVEAVRDVSAAVTASFREDHPRKLAIMRRLPSALRPLIAETLTLPGSARYTEWCDGRRSYVLAALRKC